MYNVIISFLKGWNISSDIWSQLLPVPPGLLLGQEGRHCGVPGNRSKAKLLN